MKTITDGAFYCLDIEDVSKIKLHNDGFVIFYKNGLNYEVAVEKIGTEWLQSLNLKTNEAIQLESVGVITVIFLDDVSSLFLRTKDLSDETPSCELVVIHKSTKEITTCQIKREDAGSYHQKIREIIFPKKTLSIL